MWFRVNMSLGRARANVSRYIEVFFRRRKMKLKVTLLETKPQTNIPLHQRIITEKQENMKEKKKTIIMVMGHRPYNIGAEII